MNLFSRTSEGVDYMTAVATLAWKQHVTVEYRITSVWSNVPHYTNACLEGADDEIGKFAHLCFHYTPDLCFLLTQMSGFPYACLPDGEAESTACWPLGRVEAAHAPLIILFPRPIRSRRAGRVQGHVDRADQRDRAVQLPQGVCDAAE